MLSPGKSRPVRLLAFSSSILCGMLFILLSLRGESGAGESGDGESVEGETKGGKDRRGRRMEGKRVRDIEG